MAELDGKCLLEERILQSSAYFSALVELVPAKFYEADANKNEVYVGGKSKIPQSGKAARELRKQLAKRARYLKLDPGQHKTIKEMQEMIEERENALLEESDSDTVGCTKPTFPSKFVTSSSSLNEIRSKLHNRLDAFQALRKGKDESKSQRKNTTSKSKKDKKSLKRSKEKIVSVKPANKTSNTALVNGDSKAETISEQDVLFSNLDFGKSNSKKNKRKQSDKRILEKVMAKKQKLSEIEKEDKSKASEMKSADVWKRALKHAEGAKIKDDAKLLKKSIKRRDKQKEKSAKKWKERIDQQQKHMNEKQKLRKEHLKERRETKKKGKMKKKSVIQELHQEIPNLAFGPFHCMANE